MTTARAIAPRAHGHFTDLPPDPPPLPTTIPPSTTRCLAPSLPPRLGEVLAGAERLFELPLPTPAERAALGRAIAEMEAAQAGAPAAAIDIAIGQLALAFPPVKQSEAAAAARLAIYREALADLPPDILAAAVKACIRNCRFFPTVAEIREGARGALAVREWQLGRLRMLAWRHDREFRGEMQ